MKAPYTLADGAAAPLTAVEGVWGGGFCRLCWSSNGFRSAGAEGNDASHRVVGRDANRDAIPWNNLDAEAPHAAAELGEHFVSGVALYAVETSAVNRDHGALHVDQIVLTQTARFPFIFLTKHCATRCRTSGHLVNWVIRSFRRRRSV